jgi:hypothetical protein
MPPNKGMKLTKLRAAPVWQTEVPPCARSCQSGAGTASQLIPGVRQTRARPTVTGDTVASGCDAGLRHCLLSAGIVLARERAASASDCATGRLDRLVPSR